MPIEKVRFPLLRLSYYQVHIEYGLLEKFVTYNFLLYRVERFSYNDYKFSF